MILKNLKESGLDFSTEKGRILNFSGTFVSFRLYFFGTFFLDRTYSRAISKQI